MCATFVRGFFLCCFVFPVIVSPPRERGTTTPSPPPQYGTIYIRIIPLIHTYRLFVIMFARRRRRSPSGEKRSRLLCHLFFPKPQKQPLPLHTTFSSREADSFSFSLHPLGSSTSSSSQRHTNHRRPQPRVTGHGRAPHGGGAPPRRGEAPGPRRARRADVPVRPAHGPRRRAAQGLRVLHLRGMGAAQVENWSYGSWVL
jgi:hypothetical protein